MLVSSVPLSLTTVAGCHPVNEMPGRILRIKYQMPFLKLMKYNYGG